MQINGREAALLALERCRREGAWSGESIDGIIRKYSLERREAALASRLCLGVLQNSTCLDYYIDFYCRSGKLEPKLRDILRLGSYQLIYMDKIPRSAAVNESVSLCKKLGYSRASGLVNAVLRRISENADLLPEIPGKGTASYLSIKYSHPEWLAMRLMYEKGYDFTEAFFRENNRESRLFIQVNRLKISTEGYKKLLQEADIDYSDCKWPDGCLELSGGVINRLPGYEDGLFYVQDRAARTAAEIAGACEGMKVLDACAAPGGKSFASAVRMKNSGRILSCDIHEKKLGLIDAGARRLGIDIIETAEKNAAEFDPALKDGFDLVIADVPCSGLGVIGKKPEIRQKKEADIVGLPSIQKKILNNVSEYVRPGGVLLYSTCTVLKSENQDIAEDFLCKHGNFVPEDYTAGEISSEKGMYTFWPNTDFCDGFFAARMRRIK